MGCFLYYMPYMLVCPTRWTPLSNVLDNLVQRVGRHRTSRQLAATLT